MSTRKAWPAAWRRAGLALALAALAGCAQTPSAPDVRLAQVAREVPGSDARWQQMAPAEAGVRVWRAGRMLQASRGMALEPGDEVETGPMAAAVLHFRGTGDTLLGESTRVRIGSLEVLFGRIFARVRSAFEASSETVVAGVEGTRFLFEVRRDRSVRVAVAEGRVTCRSPKGDWAPFRLRTHEAVLASYPGRGTPRVVPADTRELQALDDWFRHVAAAPARGWCCADGEPVPAWSNRCASGAFSTSHADAQAMCRAPGTAGAAGWCCQNGAVRPARRSQCTGRFFDDERTAAQACRYTR
jgi:hypothetical protein